MNNKKLKSLIKQKNKFEIIAIEIEKKANISQIKTLKENEIYYLNKNYTIDNDFIKYKEDIDIYNIDDLSINISAIVGKNGTGKSTLIELLFLAINTISSNVEHSLEVVNTDLEAISLYYNIDDTIYKISFGDNMKYQYKKEDNNFIYSSKEPIENNLKLEREFFYTIAVNYSQHSLNAKDMGEWLNQLFHKNDAYQTPIVIEPFRKDGNIDINRQDELVKSRLLINLLEPTDDEFNFRQLTEYLEADSLEFDINADKVQYVYKDIGFNMYGKEYIEKYLKIFFKIANIDIDIKLFDLSSIKDDIYFNIALLYIFKKLINITLTYKQYKKYHYFLKEKGIYKLDDHKSYFINLLKDTSHIIYKLRQAINFLRFRHIDIDKNTKIEDLSITISKIIEKYPNEKIEFLIPPSFLDTTIVLKNIQNEKEIPFYTLSSGEKQKIYSINSILYHLSNLDSVYGAYDKNLLRYKNVNIVLDEIELYFHPEMQREYISYLLKMIKLLKSQARLENIDSLNFIFVTHSPFILSDIVQNNVLFLNKDKEDIKTKTAIGTKTFGANIHDLLIDGFFISETIGAYVKEQIDEIVNVYQKKDVEKYKKNQARYIYIQENIGEPYIADIIKNYLDDLERLVNDKN